MPKHHKQQSKSTSTEWMINKSPCTDILATYSWRVQQSQQGCDTQSVVMYVSLDLIALQIYNEIDQFLLM